MQLKHEKEMKDPKLRKKMDPGDWELSLLKRRDDVKKRDAAVKNEKELT